MTAYGPPGGEPGQPGQPPGQYGQQPGQYGPPYGQPAPGAPVYGAAPTGARAGGIDLKTVNPLDWAIAGAALLAFVFSFFGFYSYDPKGIAQQECASSQSSLSDVEKQLCGGDSASAWHGFFGWFGVVLVVIAALVVLAAVLSPQLSLPVPIRLVGAGVAALGTIFVLLAIFIVPDWPPIADLVTNQGQYDKVIDNGVGFSWYIVLVLALAVTVLSLLRFQQTGGQLPGRPGGPAGTADEPPAPGYGQPYSPTQQFPQQPPPAPPQQGPPQGPPPGYGQQPPQGYTPPPQ